MVFGNNNKKETEEFHLLRRLGQVLVHNG